MSGPPIDIRRALLIAVIALVSHERDVAASDHTDTPELVREPAIDLGDLYAWHTSSDTSVLVLTWGGYALKHHQAEFDERVLYGIHLDLDEDGVADRDIWARYARDSAGYWGVQVVGIPGEPGNVAGATDEALSGSVAKVWSGLRDDPFFFDKEGFAVTLETGTLAFNPKRDFAVLQNTTALVIEFPLAALEASGSFGVWASSAIDAEGSR